MHVADAAERNWTCVCLSVTHGVLLDFCLITRQLTEPSACAASTSNGGGRFGLCPARAASQELL